MVGRKNIKYEEPFLHKVCSILLKKKVVINTRQRKKNEKKSEIVHEKTRNGGVQALIPPVRLKKWLKYEQKKEMKNT